MFSFFKKKKKKSDAVVEIAMNLLQIQTALADAEDNHDFNERLVDKYSRGYIFGLCDAILQSADINDEAEIVKLLTTVHVKLFGEINGENLVRKSIQEQEDPTFAKGRMKGGQDLVEFFRNKTSPIGLAGYLLNG